jgi:hypothetical protein
LRLGDNGRASIAEHVIHQFADELGVFDQQDPDAIHLQGRYSLCLATSRA